MIKPWKVISSEEIYSTRSMKFRMEKCELSDGRIMPKYYIIDFLDWVHVVAKTKEGQFIFVRQYRQAAKDIFWEIPGGSMDANSSETPMEAAKRELLEETGYVGKNWNLLLKQSPNPALQSNWIHTFVAVDCEKVQEPELDPFEELEVVLKTEAEVKKLIQSHQIQHSLILSSLLSFFHGSDKAHI